ncbi:MAG: cyclomaltodextrinase, partial [Lachnospiraceae bacterium]|nr:cyclomaltodextrinase [Lachnospiraceae bacterium]
MWAFESVFYQFYPLGMTGAPFENDGVLEHRILKVKDWIPHLKKLGINAIYFSPLFESDTHGYNTRDYRKLDVRLGTNDDFKEVTKALHENGIKVVLDGVFNHVGRGFFGFQDVLTNRYESRYKDWFHISFEGNSNYNDGLWYEGWEGNYDLVKLNLRNEEVINYLLESVKYWIDEFEIDGLRLDVAYMVDRDFLKRLRSACDSWKDEFFLVGEILGGDYKTIMNDEMCHSATNYECYKGLHSSFNSLNLFEIIHSLKRQFGPENWTLYRGKHLLSFVDNHDVSRVASVLSNEKHLPLIYTLMFTMPGIPCVYYGSEWGIKGNKSDGDPALR